MHWVDLQQRSIKTQQRSLSFECYSESVSGTKNLAFVVDDEEVIAATLVLILNASGFDAVAFVDPLKALVAAETRCPDFLITDVMMPVLNGIELAVQFKAIYPECRVLLFSGAMATGRLVDEAREKGHQFQILAKPVHPNELLSKLQQMGFVGQSHP